MQNLLRNCTYNPRDKKLQDKKPGIDMWNPFFPTVLAGGDGDYAVAQVLKQRPD